MPKQKVAVAGALTVGGVEYVIIPKAEYLRMQGSKLGVDAQAFVQDSVAKDLRAARESVGLTQAELAARLRKSQTMVSQAESGTARVSERYVRSVLAACGLPDDWNAKDVRSKKRGARKTG